jgi:hypothetical protein
MFRIGDVVEAQLSFLVIPVKNKRYKLMLTLHALLLVDPSLSMVSTTLHVLLRVPTVWQKAAVGRFQAVIRQMPTIPRPKRRVGFAEEDEVAEARKSIVNLKMDSIWIAEMRQKPPFAHRKRRITPFSTNIRHLFHKGKIFPKGRPFAGLFYTVYHTKKVSIAAVKRGLCRLELGLEVVEAGGGWCGLGGRSFDSRGVDRRSTVTGGRDCEMGGRFCCCKGGRRLSYRSAII